MSSPCDVKDLSLAVLAAHSQHQNVDTFGTMIKKFLSNVENSSVTVYRLNQICSMWNFQRRRFYDVINVLEALNFCRKTGVDEITWVGKSGFLKLVENVRTGNYDQYDNLQQCISISVLTLHFLSTFFTQKSQVINIKNVGSELSKENGRMKTIVCKLYQISFILEAAGIVEKTAIPGGIRLADEFYCTKASLVSLFSIQSLLNSPQIKNIPRTDYLSVTIESQQVCV